MARQLEYAARGESIELYDGGYEGRNQAIEMAAGHSAGRTPCGLSRRHWSVRCARSIPSTGQPAGNSRSAYRGGVAFDGGLALWRELVIHASDLDAGRGPETWSRPFCEHLFDFLAARVPEGQRFVLQPLGLPPVAIGSGARSTAVGGMLTDLAAWLAGRTPTLGSLRATAAADGVDLPDLLPWPAAVAPVR